MYAKFHRSHAPAWERWKGAPVPRFLDPWFPVSGWETLSEALPPPSIFIVPTLG
jgi:hypothetical protein